MVAESQLAKDVEPRFLMFQNDQHLPDKDHLLVQPSGDKGKQASDHPLNHPDLLDSANLSHLWMIIVDAFSI
jgi:hypothetical protein